MHAQHAERYFYKKKKKTAAADGNTMEVVKGISSFNWGRVWFVSGSVSDVKHSKESDFGAMQHRDSFMQCSELEKISNLWCAIPDLRKKAWTMWNFKLWNLVELSRQRK